MARLEVFTMVKRRIITSVLVGLLLVAPGALAGSDSDNYVSSGGVWNGGGYTVFGCPDRHEHCDLLGNGERTIPFGIGAVILTNPDGLAYNVIASGSDDLWGSNTAILLCVYAPEGDPTFCGPPEDTVSDISCGAVAIVGLEDPSSKVMIGVWTMAVQDDLSVCGATAGVVSADFY